MNKKSLIDKLLDSLVSTSIRLQDYYLIDLHGSNGTVNDLIEILEFLLGLHNLDKSKLTNLVNSIDLAYLQDDSTKLTKSQKQILFKEVYAKIIDDVDLNADIIKKLNHSKFYLDQEQLERNLRGLPDRTDLFIKALNYLDVKMYPKNLNNLKAPFSAYDLFEHNRDAEFCNEFKIFYFLYFLLIIFILYLLVQLPKSI